MKHKINLNLSTKNLLTNILVSLLSVVAMLLIIEFGTRWIFNNEIRNYSDLYESHPEPYDNSEFFNAQFIEELKANDEIKWNLVPDTRIIYPNDYAGDYISIRNNLRETVYQPDTFANAIYVFGGSTIFNGTVPDEYTICSYLQSKLNVQFPNRFKIFNYGVPSINTLQQMERLQTIKLDSGDVVIFYGGVNDALLFTSERRNGWIMGESLMSYDLNNLNIAQRLRFKIYRLLHKRSVFVEKFLNPYFNQIPERLKNDDKIKALKNRLASDYERSVLLSDSICRANNVKFFNFLQPNLLTKATMSSFEEKMLNNKYLNPPLWLLSLEKSYEVLPGVSNSINSKGVRSIDLSNIFDTYSSSYYLDYCHLTDKGTKVISSHIYKCISSELYIDAIASQ